jgi:inner membrane protein involved in colicin E2 resistance
MLLSTLDLALRAGTTALLLVLAASLFATSEARLQGDWLSPSRWGPPLTP